MSLLSRTPGPWTTNGDEKKGDLQLLRDTGVRDQSPTLHALPSELVPLLIFVLQHHLEAKMKSQK